MNEKEKANERKHKVNEKEEVRGNVRRMRLEPEWEDEMN